MNKIYILIPEQEIQKIIILSSIHIAIISVIHIHMIFISEINMKIIEIQEEFR